MSYFPLPWAAVPADSFLVWGEDICSLLADCGFSCELFEDVSDDHLNRKFDPPSTSGKLSLSAFVDNLAEKGKNARRSLEEGQIRLVRGVFRAT